MPDQDDTCIYNENLRRVHLIISGRAKRMMRIQYNRDDPRFAAYWQNCRMLIATIKGCRCEQCVARATFDAMEGKMMTRSIREDIARMGFAAWQKEPMNGGQAWMINAL